MALLNSSSVINGDVTTLIIALVTGIDIATFGVVIFALARASLISSEMYSLDSIRSSLIFSLSNKR